MGADHICPILEGIGAQVDWDYGLGTVHVTYKGKRIALSEEYKKVKRQCNAIKAVLRHEGCADMEAFYRLRGAGVIIGESPHHARLRCRLYQIYLERHLK